MATTICAVNPAYPHFKGSASAGDDHDDNHAYVDDDDHESCVDDDDDDGITSRRVAVEPSDYERNLRKSLNILAKLPKTLVILLAPIQVMMMMLMIMMMTNILAKLPKTLVILLAPIQVTIIIISDQTLVILEAPIYVIESDDFDDDDGDHP